MIIKHFITRSLTECQTRDMLDWLYDHPETAISIDSLKLNEIEPFLEFMGERPEGVWLVSIRESYEDMAFFKLKWC